MYLSIFRMMGNLALGWDGYGNTRAMMLDPDTASQVRQELCYVRSVQRTVPLV